MPGSVDFYRSLQQQNLVDEKVIESLGGITDTLKPLESTLKQHELRPYAVQRDYRRELARSTRGASPLSGKGEIKQERMQLVSVSPFRAVVKVEDEEEEEDESEEGEEFDR